VAKEGTVIVCTVSQLYLAFLNNWLISLAKQGQLHISLIVAEEYATLDFVNEGG
jgi:rhamnogalacturonan II specific xylosyltransferase